MAWRLLPSPWVALTYQKYAFSINQVEYLGHLIQPGRFEVASHTADTVGDLKTPIKDTEL